MGTFAETAIVDHHVSFADQRKQSCVSANKQKFVVSVYCCSKQTEAAIFRKFRFLFEGTTDKHYKMLFKICNGAFNFQLEAL
jgi:hypothetical protein